MTTTDTKTPTEDERETFEKWIAQFGYDSIAMKRTENGYSGVFPTRMWSAWRAALREAEGKCAEMRELLRVFIKRTGEEHGWAYKHDESGRTEFWNKANEALVSARG